MKRLPIKKAAKKVAKPKTVRKPLKKVVLPKKRKVAPKKYQNTNKPPAVNDAEIKLCMAGKWKEAAKAHQDRTGVLYRRSLVAVSSVYRTRLQAVLAAIKNELVKGR
jgi:hypothetical protein